MQSEFQIIGLVSAAIGLGSVAYLFRTLRRARASKHWPTTTGDVLEIRLDEEADGWGPYVRYAYTVDGKRHESDQISLYLPNKSTKKDAANQISPYSVGRKVSVYYNPEKHGDAILNRNVPLLRHLLWGLIAAFWLVVATGIFLGEFA